MELQIEVNGVSLGRVRDEALAIFVAEGGNPAKAIKQADKALGAAWQRLVEREVPATKAGHLTVLHGGREARTPLVYVVGAGSGRAEDLRTAAATVAKAARDAGARSLTLSVPLHAGGKTPRAAVVADALVMGAALGLYRFEHWRSQSSEKALTSLHLQCINEDEKKVRRAAQDAWSVAQGVCHARNLGNEPPNRATPSYLAEIAEGMAADHPTLTCDVLDEPTMRDLGMGGLLGVSQGSAEPGRMIFLTHEPSRPARKKKGRKQTLAFVGKGVTFDTGGISIKPGAKMDEMKFDMCGGAAVLGAMKAIALLDLPQRVVGVVPAAENMPGGRAYKPGDILRAMNGKTIEIKNTDAEGRLLLADALSYAATRLKPKPAVLVDLATLTGACLRAFGPSYAALMGNDEKLLGRLETASDSSGDALWRMPLVDDYRERVKSTVADVKNLAGGVGGGTMTAAAFLENFTEGVPWAHLDIASTAWTDRTDGCFHRGATGFGVRVLVELARAW